VEKSSRFFWARHQCYQDTDFGIRALMMPLHFGRLLVDMPLMQTFSAIMQYADHATNALLTPSRQSYFCLLCEHYFWYACFPPLWSSCFLGVRCFLCYMFLLLNFLELYFLGTSGILCSHKSKMLLSIVFCIFRTSWFSSHSIFLYVQDMGVALGVPLSFTRLSMIGLMLC
jgi:hypothetical protein